MEMDLIGQTQLQLVLNVCSPDMLKAQATLLLHPVLNFMQEKIRPGSVDRSSIPFDQLTYKFILYSAHDDQQAWLYYALKP